MKKRYLVAAAIMTIAEAMLLGCSAVPLAGQGKEPVKTASYLEGMQAGKTTAENNEQPAREERTDKKDNTENESLAETEPDDASQSTMQPRRMVLLDGKLYVETDETNSMLRCGVMDGTITSTTDGAVPTEDGQSNFGKDIGFQRGMRRNRIEICLDNVWHIFAYNENNLDNVAMTVRDVTKKGCTVTVTNDSKSEITYGEDYLLETLDAETGEWTYVPDVVDGEWGFHDIGYPVSAGTARDWEVDWTWLYGELAPGEYRIVKTVLSEVKSEGMRTEGTGTNVEYTLLCKFEIEQS